MQSLGTGEEPVEPHHRQANRLGGGARRGRIGQGAWKDRVAEGVRRHLDRVVSDRAQGAEALDDGQMPVELVAAGEAADP